MGLAIITVTACGDARATDDMRSSMTEADISKLMALKSKLGPEVIDNALNEYRQCVAAELEIAKALDDPKERTEFIVEGKAHCKTRMETALHIAGNKADMRALTESLIESAKTE